MKSLILLTFFVLGWVFYHESGGSDFVPRKAELMAAAEARAAADAEHARAAALKPAPTPITVQFEVVTAAKDAPASAAQLSAAKPAATGRSADETLEVTLVSLEQSGALFARPLQQLEDQGADPAAPGVTPPTRKLDIRRVTGARVNMRSGPGTRFGLLASLSRGDEVEVISDEGTGWIKMRTKDGRVGWMAEYLLGPPAG